MTDSVKPWTRLEITHEARRGRSAPPGDGRHDRRPRRRPSALVAPVVEKPDVFLVHVDVDEAAQLRRSRRPGAPRRPGNWRSRSPITSPTVSPLAWTLASPLVDGPQRRRNAHGHRHAMVSYNRRFFSLNTHRPGKSTLDRSRSNARLQAFGARYAMISRRGKSSGRRRAHPLARPAGVRARFARGDAGPDTAGL